MRMVWGGIFVLVGLFFCISDSVLAATLILKTGEKVEGEILKRTDKYIKLKRSMGTTIYFTDSIESITYDTPSETKGAGQPLATSPTAAEPKRIPEVRRESEPVPAVEPLISPQIQEESSTTAASQPEYQAEIEPEIPPLTAGEVQREEIPETPPKGESAPPMRETPQQTKPQIGPRDNVMISSQGELLQQEHLPEVSASVHPEGLSQPESLDAYQSAPQMREDNTQENPAHPDSIEIKPEVATTALQVTMSELSNITTALQLYKMDCGSFPTTEQGLAALVKEPTIPPLPTHWLGPYLAKVPQDVWGRPYRYAYSGEAEKGVELFSLGPDGIEGTKDDIR